MDNIETSTSYFPKIFGIENFSLKPDVLSSGQKLTLWLFIVITIAAKILIIPYNMMDMGDSATRVWNALMWAEHPFFVLPESGHPLWFYMMGPAVMVTKEIFYTPIITMILLMTLAGYYIFKTTLVLSDFSTALIAFTIFILNPVIFRLNFEPYSQQPYLAAVCVMIYYFIKALGSEDSKKYFTISGVFAFIGLFSRPEAIFIIVPLCIIAFMTRRKGCCNFIFISLAFQVVWIVISMVVYGSPFKTLEGADQYTDTINIQGLSLGLRLQGLFIPYYFLVLGLTIFVFWYFLKGLIYSYKHWPKVILLSIAVPILAPAIINGLAGAKSIIYQTTHYIYLMFFYSPIFAAVGLTQTIGKMKSPVIRAAFASVVILTCIPLSYVKDFVPFRYNKMFPKVIQMVATTEDPEETRELLKVIDENIKLYPALIFDAQNSTSSIFYVPYRTMLPASPADNPPVMISGYNIPVEKESLRNYIRDFMARNKSGIVMVKKSGTMMSEIFSELASGKQYIHNDFVKSAETEKWIVYLYK